MFQISQEALEAMKALFTKRMNAKLKKVEKSIQYLENFYTTIKETVKTATLNEITFDETLISFEFTDTRYEGKNFRFTVDLDGDRETIHAEVFVYNVDGIKTWIYCGKLDQHIDPMTNLDVVLKSNTLKES